MAAAAAKDTSAGATSTACPPCMFGTNCYRRHPDHFTKFSHHHLESCRDVGSLTDPAHKEQWEILRGLGLVVATASSPIVETKSSPKKVKRKATEIPDKKKEDQQPQEGTNDPGSRTTQGGSSINLSVQGAASPHVGKKTKKYKVDVEAKVERLGGPFRIFYNKVKDAPETHGNGLFMADLLHPSMGDIKSSLQINFMVEPDWLMMNYQVTGNADKPLLILHGDDNLAQSGSRLPDNVKTRRIKSRYPFGTHHSKVMVMIYTDDSVRVVVHTSNLIGDDWENRTQALWVGPACPPLPGGQSHQDDRVQQTGLQGRLQFGDSETLFKRDFLRYLKHYEAPELKPYIEAVRNCDFGAVNAIFVGSVPGSHPVIHSSSAVSENWGHAAVRGLLKKHISGAPDLRNWHVVVQCSSIGSLGPKYEGSVLQELASCLRASAADGAAPSSSVKLVYPSKRDVFGAFGGPLYGGGCLPYSRKTHQKQSWLRDHMHSWRSDSINRSRAMPHVKSYTLVNPQSWNRAAYFLLTSANLSKAAWGSLNKNGDRIFIMSYEAGVLLLPKFVHKNDSSQTKMFFDLTSAAEGEDRGLVLPYDLPLTKYRPDDEPWVVECLMD